MPLIPVMLRKIQEKSLISPFDPFDLHNDMLSEEITKETYRHVSKLLPAESFHVYDECKDTC